LISGFAANVNALQSFAVSKDTNTSASWLDARGN